MFAVFVLGYILIAQEHVLKIDKAAIALLLGVAIWGFYIVGAGDILPGNIHYEHFLQNNPDLTAQSKHSYIDFIAHHEITEHLADIASIIVFLLAAMTIVELIDSHEGFRVITDRIKTTDKIKLLWMLSFISFFMSAALDNLTTSIVMITLLKKLVTDNKRRWFFASMIIIAANAGGAWSPIGDVTTIMLWIGGQVTAAHIITHLILPSIITILTPLVIVSFGMKGNVTRPQETIEIEKANRTSRMERQLIFSLGVFLLMMVPVFKTVTGLPPYMGMLGALGIIWIVTELLHKPKPIEYKSAFTVTTALKKVDFSSILFFLGILLAVAGLQSAGHLRILSHFLDQNLHNIYAINLVIGVLSSVVDNVPLVAGAMGMYDVVGGGADGYQSFFMQNGSFWEFLAYCAGTGGSILIIGSAAGVVVMGMLKIDFTWYLKRISLLALSGYLAGAVAYYGMSFL
ncbi:sodium/proton antiporter, NhaD family [Tangfeifania diversioriginum]|uniref:Sodium/proton antiporter, NhaD family n=2 Tax=Tangfeifania diversioriginum TaxID=1168035 RepID=A0A1M6PNZ7_9BACT|nr:sodium/proton antiporter, NhaD family [Tangfeifania diversioriginum]